MQTSNHDAATGEVTFTDLTADEIAKLEAKALAKAEAEEAKATAKAALLERLGITAEEAILLFS